MKAAAILLSTIPAALCFGPSSFRSSRSNTESRAHRPSTDLRASLEAILFDCDGVLADTERDGHRISFNIAFQENAINEEWGEERYGKLLETGGGKERMTAHWNEVGWPEQIPEENRAAKILELHLRKTDIFMNLIDEGKIPLRPGVLRLVDEAIANNIRLAVCSTSNEKAVSNLVSTLMGKQRASKFQIFAGDMVKAKKPAPDVYLMAVDQMGLDKSRCVIIEDSHIGVGAAVAADIACLVTKSSYTANEDFTGAKMIVEELGADPRTGVTLATLNGLLENGSEPAASLDLGVERGSTAAISTFPTGSRGIGVQMEGHIEKGGASWTGARFGDDTPQRLQGRGYSYTPSETYAASSPRGIGVRMEGHVERGGASWTGARFGEDESKQLRGYKYTPSETYEASSTARGLGVSMEDHIEKGGVSWTGARLGDGITGKKCGAPTPSKWHE
ncbi:hypothetical protein ACHAXN_005083 [Cyclotella atomus]